MADLTAIQKKLPFKPTALRKARPALTPSTSTELDGLQNTTGAGDDSGGARGDEQDSLALFRRAKEMAPIVEADRERRLRRLQQKQRAQEEERRRALAASKHTLVDGDDEDAARTTPPITTREMSITDDDVIATGEEFSRLRELVTPPPSKRSRRDSSDAASRRKDVDRKSSTESAPGSPTTRGVRSLAPDRSMTPAHSSRSLYSSGASMPAHGAGSQTRQGGVVPAGSQVILLDSDSEADIAEADTATSSAARPLKILDQSLTEDHDMDMDMSEDDDEFAEYVRKAQEQRDKDLLRVEQEAADASLFAPTSPTPPAQPETASPFINIVVTSEIPDTRPCLVKFRFDRPMRLVRDNWTALQHRHKVPLRDLVDRDDDVILTWRRKKVYMTSTLLSLRILPSATTPGAAVVERSMRDGFNDTGTRVHMQAWTPALFAQMEREDEAARRQREMPSETAGEGGEGNDAEDDEEEEKSAAAAMVRVVLKSRDREPVKLKVLPETTTDLLVAAFRAQRDVPPGADVALWFDGMRLQEGATMEDADIDDMDTIEVHVK
ncbi:uncharacterized protein BBA_00339 [Beauveria bassiana ARSEF 2860]|uniref:Ubiquitin-like domain-containing protein n=1 Tax=Beauveria bassiana (strain ARSEF 2860) TaxID=655819 RepID=J4KRC4_BEAB2|nr:uncharacterized protein BBA_00339 [Beauveria bassiana ARSEF 2860]EJP70709.1 hypothetical protein BBA_00339 [Beauveria bassiana ARSEF 2860]